MELGIDFRLRADVNDTVFEMNGTGVGDTTHGTCELHLASDPGFPVGFDPVSCPRICSHPTSLFFTRPLDGHTTVRELTAECYAVAPARDTRVYDETGDCVLHLSVTSRVWREADIVHSHHEMRGFSSLPAIGRNITPAEEFLLPDGIGHATGVARFKMLSKAGALLDGMVVVPMRWDAPSALETPITRRIDNIDVEWDGGQLLSAYYTTSSRAMSADSVTAAHVAELLAV